MKPYIVGAPCPVNKNYRSEDLQKKFIKDSVTNMAAIKYFLNCYCTTVTE